MQNRCRLSLHKRMILGLMGILVCIICFGSLTGKEASAAGASISITSSNSTAVKGETVYVLITVKSASAISGFEAYFSYDNRVLQFQTGGSVVFGNDDEFRIEDVERESSSTEIKYSVKFRARRPGSTTITLKKPYNVFGESTSDKMSVSYNSLTVVVRKKGEEAAPAVPSSQPQQDRVPATVEPQEATAKPAKKKKKKKKVKPSPKVVPEETPDVVSRAEDVPENGVHALKEGDTIILYGSSSIQIAEPEENQIPSGFGRTELEIDGQRIPAYALESETEHGYVLVYGKTEAEEAFYLYDREQNMLLPYDKVRAWYRSNAGGVVAEQESEAVVAVKRLKYIVGILIAFCGLMVLAVISLFMKYKGMDPDELN